MNRALISIHRLAVWARALLMAISISGGLLMAQPALTITSPKNGTVVNPGQILDVTVETWPPGAFRSVIVIGDDPIGLSDALGMPPYRFSLKIPLHVRPRQYTITANGFTEPGRGTNSEPVAIQVEHPGIPLSLTAEPGVLVFQYVGDECAVAAIGRFADADRVDLEESTYTTYVSDALKVATVTADGHVTAVGPGSAKITIRYKGKLAVVPVTVRKPPAGRW